MSNFDERGAELRELFFETAQELLQSLNDEALKLEQHPGDAETVRSIRRIVHTLKGDAAACGYRELSNLAHELEDALALESAASHASLAEIAFIAADTFGGMLASYRQQSELPSGEPLRKRIRELAEEPSPGKQTRKKPAKAESGPAEWTEYQKLAIRSAAAQGKRVYHVTTQIDPHCAMPIAARQLVLNAIAGIGEVLGERPQTRSPKGAALVELLVASEKPAQQVSAKCCIPTITASVNAELVMAPPQEGNTDPPAPEAQVLDSSPQSSGGAAQPPAAAEENVSIPAAQLGAPAAPENVLRVEAARIDNVLNLVGELIIGKSMLQQVLNDLARYYPKESIHGRFGDAVAFQSRVLSDLQRSVMKIRMVPVEQLFRRFPRMVRDVAKQCGKEVRLLISGQDTDLDKSLLDAIAEPLTHLVRNAVSHGIERAEERVRAGKPAGGTVRLSAYHQGNQVIVEVNDDGRGIDAQKVKSKALERGLIAADEAGRISESEILDLVFRPGLSTADEVTEVAGRGVGLDVVQSVLSRLKGTVEIQTRSGQGTTFRLKLPLTLAIIKALLFRVEQRLYAIPLNAVAEIARAHESDLHQVDNYEVLQSRNQVLPLLRLGRPPAERPDHGSPKIFVLVIAAGERKLGLLVDALEGEEELVIKALDDQTVATDLISGASILGDGRVVLIVNLAAIVERYAKSRPSAAGVTTSGILLPYVDRARIVQGPAEAQP